MAFAVVLIIGFVPTMVSAGGGGGTDIKRDTVGVVRNVDGDAIWFTRSSNDGSCTTFVSTGFGIGTATDIPIVVDLDGDGTDQGGAFRNQSGGVFGSYYIVDEDNPTGPPIQLDFGAGTDLPLAANMDPADPGDELGVYRPSTNTFYLNLDSGLVEIVFGIPNDLPIVGNWDNSADGSEEIGLYRPSTNMFFLRADNMPGADSVTQRDMGQSGDRGIVGDWSGDGRTTIGVYRDFMNATGGVHYLNNSETGGAADETITFGDTGDLPVQGDWDGRTVDNDGCNPA